MNAARASAREITPPMDFGRVTVGSTSGTGVFSGELCALPNSVAFTVNATSITGAEAANFSIPASTNTCNGATLNPGYPCYTPGNECIFYPVFQPQRYGKLAATADFSTSYQPITWIMEGLGGIIVVPLNGDNISIVPGSANTYNSAPIQFQAAGVSSGATVHWKTVLHYQTSGKLPTTPASATLLFPTTGGGQATQTYTSQGGQLTVTATVGTFTDKVTDVITGPPVPPGIPDATISAELKSLYASGASPDLLCQIAHKESSYAQFAEETLYKVGSLWPKESPPVTGHPAGSYIGLMQAKLVANGYKTAMETAWDWIDNAQAGHDILESKLPYVQKLQANAQSTHKGLPDLTPTQIEDVELGMYSGYAPSSARYPAYQYYAPQCVVGGKISGEVCAGGSWQWLVNQNQKALKTVNYVNSVRGQPGC